MFGTGLGVIKNNFDTGRFVGANESVECDTGTLRLVNFGLAMLLFIALYRINLGFTIGANFPRAFLSRHASHQALNDFLCPGVFFYYFLYYTDTGGLAFVMWGYMCSLRNYHKTATLVGLFFFIIFQRHFFSRNVFFILCDCF